MRKIKTILRVAVLCNDGVTYPPGTPIEQIPAANRESVALRYAEDVIVDEGKPEPPKPAAKKQPAPQSPTPEPSPPAEAPQGAPPPPPPSDPSPEPDPDPQPATPLPAMAEELLALLKAGGIETLEQATEYVAKNKSFRPLKGIGDAKDLEIRAALGL